MQTYISAGELAKLASTTKRTIHFYDELGILKPAKVDGKGYRLYTEKQVLDYQKILLLTTFGVSLAEIKTHLTKKQSLTKLFHDKTKQIKSDIAQLEFTLDSLEKIATNIEENGTMVDPQIKAVKPFEIYYIEKIGSYSKIGEYTRELADMFSSKGNNFTTLAIFEEQGYRPKESKIKIAAFANRSLWIKPRFASEIKKMHFAPGKVISYTYHGSGSMLSLFWKELEKYCRINKIKPRTNTPDFEIYWKVSDVDSQQKFEIFMPIE